MTVTPLRPPTSFGIYVHWPFCAAKCPYCDFNSHVRHNPVDQNLFLQGYELEIAHMASMAKNRKVSSIFFGGGTPSLMEPDTVEAILSAIETHWPLAENVEISLEANPTSVEAERFKAYQSLGINRLSLGIQSLRDDQLKFLGRRHSVQEARSAIELARSIFPRISFDLIYARPDQSIQAWAAELGEALELAADHLSLYQLTIEQGTPFFDLHRTGKLTVPDQDLAASLYEITQELTGDAGFDTYEISNHAKPEAQCRHNLVYWRYHDYAGIGPGAHGRLTTRDGKVATACERNPEIWWQQANVKGHGMVTSEILTREEQSDELLVMNLRLLEGMDQRRYQSLAGHPLNQKRKQELIRLGFVEELPDGHIRATPKGFLVLDAVVADLGMEED